MDQTPNPGSEPDTTSQQDSMPAPSGAAPSLPLRPPSPIAPAGASSAPLQPGVPSPSFYSTDPNYPGPPTQPSTIPYPSYPTYPTYSGYPSAPGVPGAPTTMPLSTGSYAPYVTTLVPPKPPRVRSRWNPRTWLSGPVPVPIVLLVGLVMLAAIAAGVWEGIQRANGDWAAGAIIGGKVALGLVALVLIVMGLRIGFGRRGWAFFAPGFSAVLVLAGLGGAGIKLLPLPLHRAQAQAFELHRQWTDAITQYQRAGERPPGSHDLARVYDEWGDDLANQQQYYQASTKYEMVISVYPNATIEVQRAQQSDAHVLFEYGTQLAGQGYYQIALEEFAQLRALYPGSPFATESHAGSATAYYALGRQELANNDCPSALSNYQTLAQQYADTAQGAQAKQALAAGVDVTGSIQNFPYYGVTGFLSHHINPPYFSDDYSVQVNQSAEFVFHHVKPATYNLSVVIGYGQQAWWAYPTNPYTITVGQLCAVNFGAYGWG